MPKKDIYDALRKLPSALTSKYRKDDARLNEFERNMIRVQKEMMNRVLGLVNKLEIGEDGNILSNTDNIGTASKSLATLRRSLTRSGYKELVADHVAGFGDNVDQIINIARAVGVEMDVAVLDPKELTNLQGEYLSEFDEIGEKAVKELKKGIYDATLNGTPSGDLISNLQKTIIGEDKRGGKLKNYAKTYAQTSQMGYDRHVGNRMAEETGFVDYIYLGPDDSITRPFCNSHINKVFTLEEIQSLSNGQNLSVRQYGGGWNCRHFFQVVDPETAQEIRENGLEMPGKDKKTPPKPKVKPQAKPKAKAAPKARPKPKASPKPPKVPKKAKGEDGDPRVKDGPVPVVNVKNDRANKVINNETTDDARRIIKNLRKPREILPPDRGRSHYKPGSTRIYANLDSQETLLHEYGHHIDHMKAMSGKVRSSSVFRVAYGEDRARFTGNNARRIQELKDKWYTVEQLYRKRGPNKGKNYGYMSKTKESWQSGVTDIVDALTMGRAYDEYGLPGHGGRYYKQAVWLKDTEIYANMFSAWSRKDRTGWDEIKELFPSMSKAFQADMDETLNKVDWNQTYAG